MGNPIQDKSKLERFIVGQCCFFFTLRTGSLIIGIFELIIGVLWFIGAGTAGGRGSFSGFVSGVLLLAAGILVLLAIYKALPKYLWISVYINVGIAIWLLVSAIIFFVYLAVGLAIGALINMVVLLYFASVLRSYAFEFESSPTEVTSPA